MAKPSGNIIGYLYWDARAQGRVDEGYLGRYYVFCKQCAISGNYRHRAKTDPTRYGFWPIRRGQVGELGLQCTMETIYGCLRIKQEAESFQLSPFEVPITPQQIRGELS